MPKRVLEGVVVSASQDKTVVVRVERTYTHGLYKKIVRRSKKYHAHDEANSTTIGARVSIRECKPRSKLKTWEIVSGEELAQAAGARSHAETGDRDVVAETAQGDDA